MVPLRLIPQSVRRSTAIAFFVMIAGCLQGCGSDPATDTQTSGTSRIAIEDSAFATSDRFDGDTIIVTGSQTREITAALEAAAERFSMVTDSGAEWTQEQWDAAPDGEDIWTVPYVSDVRVEADGPALRVDFEGDRHTAVRRQFKRILVEELERAGVIAARVWSPPATS